MIVRADTRADYRECRFNAIGEANGQILRVTYAICGGAVRIGLAGKSERPTEMADKELTG